MGENITQRIARLQMENKRLCVIISLLLAIAAQFDKNDPRPPEGK